MIKYKYQHETYKILETKVSQPQEKYKWVEDQLNALGAQGKRVVGNPMGSMERSDITLHTGQPLSNFVIVILVETTYVEYSDEDDSEEETEP